MAKKKKPKRQPKPPPAAPSAELPAVTRERFARLYKLVHYLGGGAKTRESLTAHLGLDVRGFYRDLEVLRAFGVEVALAAGLYTLTASGEELLARLPYPDPHLTLGEMQQLAKGRTLIHRRVREQIDQLLS
jgi:predicted DNA-binding transcriptional regulator YafY